MCKQEPKESVESFVSRLDFLTGALLSLGACRKIYTKLLKGKLYE